MDSRRGRGQSQSCPNVDRTIRMSDTPTRPSPLTSSAHVRPERTTSVVQGGRRTVVLCTGIRATGHVIGVADAIAIGVALAIAIAHPSASSELPTAIHVVRKCHRHPDRRCTRLRKCPAHPVGSRRNRNPPQMPSSIHSPPCTPIAHAHRRHSPPHRDLPCRKCHPHRSQSGQPTALHGSQLSQQTTISVIGPSTVTTRFTNSPVVSVQDSPPANVS